MPWRAQHYFWVPHFSCVPGLGVGMQIALAVFVNVLCRMFVRCGKQNLLTYLLMNKKKYLLPQLHVNH